MPAVVSTDILPAPWLDALADAQRLPFAAASFDNIEMFDVLHHLDQPRMFLQEAERVLRRGGRIVMVGDHSLERPVLSKPPSGAGDHVGRPAA